MNKTRVGVVGTGWRAQFFLRILHALEDRFEVVGVVCRGAEALEQACAWGENALGTHEALVDLAPDYVLLCVDRENAGPLMRWYGARDIPLLVETFPAKDEEELRGLYGDLNGAPIQFAEQYMHQPLHAARIACAQSGLLGDVYQVQTSIPNGYHAVAVQRKLLGVGRKCPVICANQYAHAMLNGPGRGGDPTEDALVTANQVLFQLDYGSCQAINDVEDNQHRSFFRTQHFVLRGTRGEIREQSVLYMRDIVTPCHFQLERVVAGGGPNLEGLFLRGVRGGGEGWYYRNPFMPARLADDEIASATCLVQMAEYVRGGPSFYPLAEELMDMYLTLMIDRAIEAGTKVAVPPQPWTE